jgi:tRNA nucleotidyltransferase (CCA-adding enzyme)
MTWKDDVLKRVKPSKDEEKEIADRISNFIKRLNKLVGDAKAVLGGSGAKGTWLKGEHDADVFVLFPFEKYNEKTSELGSILEKRVKKGFKKHDRLHGSRDYIHIVEGGFTYEVVPILSIKKSEDAVNITDVSPLHAKWVIKNSTQKLRDDIRLAKAFCRAQKMYGAESYIKGFSGYILEVLVIYYGGFEKLLKAAVTWDEKQVIDAGRLYNKKENVWDVMNTAKLFAPLIIIDPVDKSRNAAAALGKDKWLLFKKKAAAFMKKPSLRFFEKDEVTFEQLKKRKGHVVWVDVEGLARKGDIAGAKMLQVFDFVGNELDDFAVLDSGWDFNSGVLWYIVKDVKRPKTITRKGPPVSLKEHAAAFKKRNKKTVVKKGILWATIPVKNYLLESVVKNSLKETYVKERVKKVKNILLD